MMQIAYFGSTMGRKLFAMADEDGKIIHDLDIDFALRGAAWASACAANWLISLRDLSEQDQWPTTLELLQIMGFLLSATAYIGHTGILGRPELDNIDHLLRRLSDLEDKVNPAITPRMV